MVLQHSTFAILFCLIYRWLATIHYVCVCGLVAQSCPTLCDPLDCSLPGSSVHGILQARILEWVTISFSRASSLSRDQTWVFYMTGRFSTFWATREALTTEGSILNSAVICQYYLREDLYKGKKMFLKKHTGCWWSRLDWEKEVRKNILEY